ncbi:cytochrome P450 [Conexibacter sp. W3-3-2]|uniref:cytochrome P450 n=1 Tax=Conexibacter sp. W3-3-2 TaxID=2675227 RepID=UPI0012B97677|nr:cytochrome P450 [Conexibacter sp. W3-3-2]MTD43921.1 cytochrome P450 [Conexibacter sp. W3-3-2]
MPPSARSTAGVPVTSWSCASGCARSGSRSSVVRSSAFASPRASRRCGSRSPRCSTRRRCCSPTSACARTAGGSARAAGSPGGSRSPTASCTREIAERRRAGDLDARDDVLSLLLRARDEDGQALSDAELRDELVTLLAAGHETTATALAFAFEFLLRDPAALARARAAAADGDDAHLDAVGRETLRLRPVLDATERTLTRPREVAGFELPAGVRVYPAIALIHRRPDLHDDPLAFRPERFAAGETPPYSWLPFGGGIRRCIGAPLAQAEIVEVLRVALSRVELLPRAARPDPVVLRGITIAPRDGVRVRVVRRLSRPRAAAPGGSSRSSSSAAPR